MLRGLLWAIWWIVNVPVSTQAYLTYRRYLRTSKATPPADARPGTVGVAIVCYSYHHFDSMDRLIRGLNAEGFAIYLVCNREPTNRESEAWGPLCAEVRSRPNFGYDWAAYKELYEALSYVRPHGDLVLANDSVYYFEGTERLVSTLAQSRAAVSASSINFEGSFHAQSFLMRIREDFAWSSRTRKFFRRYKVRYSKRHSIDKGELELSRILQKQGADFEAVFSSTALFERLSADPDALWWPEISAWIPAMRTAPAAEGSVTLRQEVVGGLTSSRIEAVLLQGLGMAMETTNSTIGLGLTLTRALGAPLKLDLNKWGHAPHTSAEVQMALEGRVVARDLSELVSWFGGRPNFASHRGLDRLFYRYGIR